LPQSTRRATSPGPGRPPIAELRRHLRVLPEGTDIVAYCRGPYCVFADKAMRELTASGFQARRLIDGFPRVAALRLSVATGTETRRPRANGRRAT
jgi:hypothetical protein